MITTKCHNFKGEIENYLRNSQNNFDIKIDRAFCSLKLKTWLCKSNIIKRDGYAIINYLNEKEHHMGVGPLFEELADKTATFTYAQRIWLFFKDLFEISFTKIFELFEIEDDFQSFFDTLNQSVSSFAPIQGCET